MAKKSHISGVTHTKREHKAPNPQLPHTRATKPHAPTPGGKRGAQGAKRAAHGKKRG